MERVVNIARNFEEAEEWDIMQQVNLTPEQRLEIARELEEQVYGCDTIDVRASGSSSKRTLRKGDN